MGTFTREQELVFEDLARQLDSWIETAREATADPSADLIWASDPDAWRRLGKALRGSETTEEFVTALRETLLGFAHSVLVMIDGGTELAEQMTVDLTSSEGRSIGDGLHELFTGYLIETGRLTVPA